MIFRRLNVIIVPWTLRFKIYRFILMVFRTSSCARGTAVEYDRTRILVKNTVIFRMRAEVMFDTDVHYGRFKIKFGNSLVKSDINSWVISQFSIYDNYFGGTEQIIVALMHCMRTFAPKANGIIQVLFERYKTTQFYSWAFILTHTTSHCHIGWGKLFSLHWNFIIEPLYF